ncbi:hypothetical protein DOY81_011238, partial [Sarcophaga bullata]
MIGALDPRLSIPKVTFTNTCTRVPGLLPPTASSQISDSQNISQPNGTQQTQRKQLEVLQTCTPTGGAMQVIRSQTVQTTSSRWSTSSASATASPLLLTANNTSNNTSPITTQMQKQTKQKTHTSNDYCSSSSITNSNTNTNTSPSSFTSPSLLTNGFNHHHHHQHLQQHYKQLEQLRQQHNKLQISKYYGHNNLSRDSSRWLVVVVTIAIPIRNSGNNHTNNQLFLLDTAPSLKLSNLMKSSSSLSNSSNNSTTASQATTVPNTTATTMNTHKTLANNKVSLHAIVGSGSNNHMTTATTTSSSTPSPTLTSATQRPSWQQQPTLYRQNSNGNATHSHLMKTRVGDNNNGCCSRSGSGSG